MRGEGRPRNKQYWVVGIFMLPLVGMLVYMLNFDYSKVDRKAASQLPFFNETKGGAATIQNSQSSSGLFSIVVRLDKKSFKLQKDGTVEISGIIVIANPAPFPMTIVDMPLQNQKFWSPRIAHAGGALGQQITGFPLKERYYKNLPADAIKLGTEVGATELQGGRELQVPFFCVTPPHALLPGKYLFSVACMAGTYARQQNLSLQVPDQYSQAVDFEVPPDEKAENVPPAPSPE